MSTDLSTQTSYQHNLDHAEILDFIKAYSYRGMVTEVAEEIVKENGGVLDSAKQLVTKVKAGRSKNKLALQLLVKKAKTKHRVILDLKKEIN